MTNIFQNYSTTGCKGEVNPAELKPLCKLAYDISEMQDYILGTCRCTCLLYTMTPSSLNEMKIGTKLHKLDAT